MVAPELPELAVGLLSCWEVAVLAAGMVVGFLALCEGLSCPDTWDGVVVAGGAALGVVGVAPATVVGDIVVGDGDGPAMVVVVML